LQALAACRSGALTTHVTAVRLRAACPAGLGAAFPAVISASKMSRAGIGVESSIESPLRGPRRRLWRRSGRRHSRIAISLQLSHKSGPNCSAFFQESSSFARLSCCSTYPPPMHVSSRPIAPTLGGARPGRWSASPAALATADRLPLSRLRCGRGHVLPDAGISIRTSVWWPSIRQS
jgi:hypothetical protein